jgi:flagellar assembly factor FliW
MKIQSPRFGAIDVADDKVIRFPHGLPGFEDCKQFALLHPDAAQPRIFYLQSVDQPDLAFSIASPEQFGLHYNFSLSDAELTLIGLNRIEDASVMVILRQEGDKGGEAPVHAVLTAPLVINLATRLGLQKTLASLGCDITLTA